MKKPIQPLFVLAVSLTATSLATVVPAQVVDLSQLGTTYPGFRIDGDDFFDESGRSASGAGDVNGDGLADLIVGAPNADSNRGECYVVFGKTGSATVSLASLGSGGFLLQGSTSGDLAGVNVSGAGDVNGDGLGDLIVGASLADPDGKASAGEVYVVFGKRDSSAVNLGSLGQGGFRIEGIVAGDRAGDSVAGAGDVNGDGLADLIVGALYANYGLGESYVVFGKTGTDPVSLGNLETENAGFRIDGITPADSLGRSASGAGDVNGDGLADLIVGALNADPNGNGSGESYVVFGKSDSAPVDCGNLETENAGFRIDGISGGDASGFSVSGAGDVNGDGLADVIIGAPFADPNTTSSAGQSYVVFGKADSAPVSLAGLQSEDRGFRIDGISASDNSGSSVSGAGDVNGDGLADLIVGAFRADQGTNVDAGESYVVFGKSDSNLVSLASLGAGGFQIEGTSTKEYAGRSVSAAGDVNGDGLADLIAGAPGANLYAGRSYVIFGPGPGVTPGVAAETPGTVLSPASVAAAGDPAPIVVGQGDGTQSPPARTIVDFAGAGGTLGRVTARIDKTTPLPAPFVAGINAAPIIWEVETTRTGWSSADVTFQYTEGEIAGLAEANLRLYKADSVGGTWAEVSSTVDAATNQITAVGVTGFSFFMISDVAGLPVELDGFLVE